MLGSMLVGKKAPTFHGAFSVWKINCKDRLQCLRVVNQAYLAIGVKQGAAVDLVAGCDLGGRKAPGIADTVGQRQSWKNRSSVQNMRTAQCRDRAHSMRPR